jgi:putative transposase
MDEYRHGSHSLFRIHVHVAWITKYRKEVIRGAIGLRFRDLARQIQRLQVATMPAWAGRLAAGLSRNGTSSAKPSHRLQPVVSLTERRLR